MPRRTERSEVVCTRGFITPARGQRLAGAVVVLDPWTGSVLALVSMPEPNKFATPIDPTTYGNLLSDKLNPLYDRAIGAASPTGPSFKMVTGSAAISSGVIKPHQVLYDSGSWYCHGRVHRHRRGWPRECRIRARARCFVGRLLLPARVPARA